MSASNHITDNGLEGLPAKSALLREADLTYVLEYFEKKMFFARYEKIIPGLEKYRRSESFREKSRHAISAKRPQKFNTLSMQSITI